MGCLTNQFLELLFRSLNCTHIGRLFRRFDESSERLRRNDLEQYSDQSSQCREKCREHADPGLECFDKPIDWILRKIGANLLRLSRRLSPDLFSSRIGHDDNLPLSVRIRRLDLLEAIAEQPRNPENQRKNEKAQPDLTPPADPGLQQGPRQRLEDPPSPGTIFIRRAAHLGNEGGREVRCIVVHPCIEPADDVRRVPGPPDAAQAPPQSC